jgi:hypothetical protein
MSLVFFKFLGGKLVQVSLRGFLVSGDCDWIEVVDRLRRRDFPTCQAGVLVVCGGYVECMPGETSCACGVEWVDVSYDAAGATVLWIPFRRKKGDREELRLGANLASRHTFIIQSRDVFYHCNKNKLTAIKRI